MRMASLRNAIACLERQKVPIFKETIVKVLEQQVKLDLAPKDMLKNSMQVCEGAKLLIEQEINAQRPVDMQKLMMEI